MNISPEKRRDIIDALRRGTVPRQGLDEFAVGLDWITQALDEELAKVKSGGSEFKAIRGEYGCGKTFYSRWMQERAKRQGFAASEVQISETETPLHRLETVYRRCLERLSTAASRDGAFRDIVEGWFHALEQDVLAELGDVEVDEQELGQRVQTLMEQRLTQVARKAPSFSAALRAYFQAVENDDSATAEGLVAWLSGQRGVAASVKRVAGIKGDIDHFGAQNFLQGLLLILRDSGYAGLVLVLDEVETLQRMRSDVRDKGLNALRQWMDEIDKGAFPGLYLVITGTPSFYDGDKGIQRLNPIAQRLATDFSPDGRFDSARAPQIKLQGFDMDRLQLLGCRVRDIYAEHASHAERIRTKVDDRLVQGLAKKVTGSLGGKIGIAPRLFLKKLVQLIDKVDEHEAFDPVVDGSLDIQESEMTLEERGASAAGRADDIQLDNL